MNKSKCIAFTKPETAELLYRDIPRALESGDVAVKMEYTVVSGGTERANIMGTKNTGTIWPRYLGYCGVGYVIETAPDVQKVKVGDRVLVYHGIHSDYNVRKENEITKVEDDSIDSIDAAFVIIAAMGLGGVRKLEFEIGESAMVMGLGLLGIFAVQFLRLSGVNPLIAVDLNKERRELALKLGADYAFDPSDPDFVQKVKNVTKGKGVRGTVEVTGVSAAMKQALECASWQGRISLLGCTRVSDCEIDYYSQVHRPGIKLIGAHNYVRPKVESYPHHWTHHDDCNAILDMISTGRIQVKSIVSRIAKPEQAPEIYTELCNNPEFQLGTVFDWR
jgi:2-desacetyl-2-hydroxyethyl bacteriochlorophyllide A dehydrogenase